MTEASTGDARDFHPLFIQRQKGGGAFPCCLSGNGFLHVPDDIELCQKHMTIESFFHLFSHGYVQVAHGTFACLSHKSSKQHFCLSNFGMLSLLLNSKVSELSKLLPVITWDTFCIFTVLPPETFHF